MNPTIEDAIALALRAHAGQTDKYGEPYILHPLRVMNRMATNEERTAAVLHDAIEDSDHTLDGLRAMGYPETVVHALDCLTRRSGEAYEEFIERAMGDPLARKVKLADLEDNMDIRRLPSIGEDEIRRLRKYVQAWRAMTREA